MEEVYFGGIFGSFGIPFYSFELTAITFLRSTFLRIAGVLTGLFFSMGNTNNELG
jgi:hypothetical protein